MAPVQLADRPVKYQWVMGGLGTADRSRPFVNSFGHTQYSLYAGDITEAWMGEYLSQPYTVHRLEEEILNGSDRVRRRRGDYGDQCGSAILRPHQIVVEDHIRAVWAAGAPGCLLGKRTGFGKMVLGAKLIRDMPFVQRALVIAPLSSMDDWRRTIGQMMGDGGKQIAVVHYEQVYRLFDFDVPTGTMRNQIPSMSVDLGTPRHRFDLVIIDEAHRTANTETVRFAAVQKLIQGAFFVHMSATPMTVPSDGPYLAPLLGWRTGIGPERDLFGAEESYADWYGRIGKRLGWDTVPNGSGGHTVTRTSGNDEAIRDALFDPDAFSRLPPGIGGVGERPGGVPDQVRKLVPVTLTSDQKTQAQQTWMEFRQLNKLSLAGHSDPDHEFSVMLRALQQMSYIKAPHVAKYVVDKVNEGYSVIVMCWYKDSIQHLNDLINARLADVYSENGMSTMGSTPLNGETSGDERKHRIDAFNGGSIMVNRGGTQVQVGIPVIITNVTDTINLHRGTNPDGNPRITVMGDVLLGGKRTLQAEGRGQRDGWTSDAHYLYTPRSIEERMLARVLSKSASTQTIVGHSEDAARLQSMFDNLDPDTQIDGLTAAENARVGQLIDSMVLD